MLGDATHCVHGHEWTDANSYLYMTKNGPARKCRACTLKRLAETKEGVAPSAELKSLFQRLRAVAPGVGGAHQGVDPMNDLDPSVLVEKLKMSVSDPAKKLIVANLAQHSTRIAARFLTDPAGAEEEMQFVRAAVANLTAAEAVKIQNVILDWLGKLVRAAIVGA